MTEAVRPGARFRDFLIALIPVFLTTTAVLLVFLIRQLFGPARAVQYALYFAAGLPILGAGLAAWRPWRLVLDGLGLPGDSRRGRIIRSAAGVTVVEAVAFGLPLAVIRFLSDLASPFETVKWILTIGIVVQGLVWRSALSRLVVPLWMGVGYWVCCAAVGIGLWRAVAGIFV